MPAIILFFNPPLLFMYLDDLFTTNIYFNMSLGSFGDLMAKRIITRKFRVHFRSFPSSTST